MRGVNYVRGLLVAALMLAAGVSNELQAAEGVDLAGDGWHAWRTAALEDVGERCCFRWTGSGASRRTCDLDGSHGNYGYVDGFPGYGGEIQVYVLVEAGRPKRVTALSPHCAVSTATEIRDHGALPVTDSIRWLHEHLGSHRRLDEQLLAAIALHQGEHSLPVLVEVLESSADARLREQAVFWMVHSGSDAAFAYIDRLLTGS